MPLEPGGIEPSTRIVNLCGFLKYANLIPRHHGSINNAISSRQMSTKHFLRGMATVNYFADNVAAARDWYSELFGVEAYFQMPSRDNPAYIEFRIGDDADEFGIIDRKYAPEGMQQGPGGAILLWHVDDIEAAFARLKALGATEYDPITKRGETGFVTASVVDPFGNVLGIMYNPHYVEFHGH